MAFLLVLALAGLALVAVAPVLLFISIGDFMTKFDDSVAALNLKIDGVKKQVDALGSSSISIDTAAAAVDAAAVKVDAIAAELPTAPSA